MQRNIAKNISWTFNILTGISWKFYPITSKHAVPTPSLHHYNTMPCCLFHAMYSLSLSLSLSLFVYLSLLLTIKRPLAFPFDYFP